MTSKSPSPSGKSSIVTARGAMSALRRLGSPQRARELSRFFKTGPGDYGEGDRFLGVGMPPIRALTRSCRGLPDNALRELLASSTHEDRMLALCVMVDRCRRDHIDTRAAAHDLYMECRAGINNWDLVDISAPHVPGGYLFHPECPRGLWKKTLVPMARTGGLWDRRIAMIATFGAIRLGDVTPTMSIAEILVGDDHDLMHKAVGWALREAGKKDIRAERAFLDRHCRTMPRTMLRYAIERFPEQLRLSYLHAKA